MIRFYVRLTATLLTFVAATFALAQTGFIEFKGTPGTTVWLNGTSVGELDADGNLVVYDAEAGYHAVWLTLDGYESFGFWTIVEDGKVDVNEFEMKPRQGEVRVRCLPSECRFVAPLIGIPNLSVSESHRITYRDSIPFTGSVVRGSESFAFDFEPCPGDRVDLFVQFGGANRGVRVTPASRTFVDRTCPKKTDNPLQFGGGEPDVWTAIGMNGSGELRALVGRTSSSLYANNPGVSYFPGDDVVVSLFEGRRALWSRQFGTAFSDVARGVAIDGSDRVVVVGEWSASAGSRRSEAQAFVRVFDRSGADVWERIFGTAGDDDVRGVAVDAKGRIIVVGGTNGALAGPTAGGRDAYVRVYTPDGDVAWEQQFGSAGSDWFSSVAIDPVDRIVLTGISQGELFGPAGGGEDAILLVLDAEGDRVSAWQSGSPDHDFALSVAVAADGRIALGGGAISALGPRAFGAFDGVVWLFPADGTPPVVHQFGGDGEDRVTGVAFDDRGCVVATGHVTGEVFGPYTRTFGFMQDPPLDGFIYAVPSDACAEWGMQIGVAENDALSAIAVAPDGVLHAVGYTVGSLGDVNRGGADFVEVFVRR